MDIATIGKEIPSTYVPARNTIFLSIALSYAETLEADAIFIGVTAADYSGYPDCRPEYIEAFQKVVNLATKQAMMNHTIHVEAPLLLLSKAQIITYGKKLQVPFEHTWSCYSGQSKACGKCDSCLLRLKGFQESGIRDPLLYETTPHWYTLNND
jgi:7-cyano-7-deazaguanine synthase